MAETHQINQFGFLPTQRKFESFLETHPAINLDMNWMVTEWYEPPTHGLTHKRPPFLWLHPISLAGPTFTNMV